MKINLERTDACINLEHKAKRCMYGSVNNGQWWTRLTGIPLGAASGALTIATRVGTIGECIVKGSVNIMGSAWRDDCELWRGLKQLFLSSTKSIIILPFSVFSAATGMFIKTVFMVVIPKSYANNGIQRHSIRRLQYQIDFTLKVHLRGMKARLRFYKTYPNQSKEMLNLNLQSGLSKLWHSLADLHNEMERFEQENKDKANIYSEMVKGCRETPAGIEFWSNVLTNPQENFRANVLVLIRLESCYIKLFLTEMQEAVTFQEDLNKLISACKDEAQNTCFASYDLPFNTNSIKELRERYDHLVVEIRKASPQPDLQEAFDKSKTRMKTLRELTEILSKTLTVQDQPQDESFGHPVKPVKH